ncbi:MAG: hypothetical protein MJ192_05150 [Clostridia bacterium]|nr:hypothetical protein [Clostridia bacterium]
MSLSSFLKKLFSSETAPEAEKKPAFTKKTETFTFDKLPMNVEELKALPEASLDTPFKTAALTVIALNAYASNADNGAAMLNFLKGPQPLTPMEKQFIRDRFMDGKTYVPISFFAGTSPDNNYTPSVPYTIMVSDNPYSYNDSTYVSLWLTSSGADSQRQIKLRQKPSTGEWFLWEQYILSDIRKPKSEDPWA